MTASLFGTSGAVNVNVKGTLIPQSFTATASQTLFPLTAFTYTPGTNSLLVFINGQRQILTRDFTETSTTSFTLLEGCVAGDYVDVIGFPQVDLSSVTAPAVSFTQAGSTTGRTVQEKLQEVVSVKDFGAIGDGIVNDKIAIQNAFNASKKVLFPEGTYYLGQVSGGDTLIDFRALGDGISILTQGFVELVCQTVSDSVNSFFALNNNSHFYCDPIRFRDTGFIVNQSSPSRGAIGFGIFSGNYNWGNLRFAGIYGKQIVSAISVLNVGNTDIVSNRVRGIFADDIFVDQGYYGVNLAANGDGCYFKKIVTYQVFRPLFVYNVTDVEASVYARANLSTSGAINIGWFTNAVAVPKTSGIKVRYVSRENTNSLNHVLINVIGPSLGTIDGVDLELDIEDSGTPQTAVKFVTYTTSGGVETSSTLNNVVKNITVRGKVASTSNEIVCTANYTSKGRLNIDGPALYLNSTLLNNFLLSGSLSYVPTWAAATTNPVLGNGTLTGSYSIHSGLCFVSIQLTMGSTTTYGVGSWNFTLPFTSRVQAIGSARALDSGTAWYIAAALASGNVIDVTFNNTTNQASATIPITWATGDQLQMCVCYPL